MFLMRFDMRSPYGGTATTELYNTAIEMAEWAETRGCVTVALSEHHASPDGFLPSPLVLAAAVAARTKHVPIFVAAALLPFYDPIRLAEDIAVLDHVSNGRVSYVLGLGYRPEEFALYGQSMRDRARRADAKLEVLLAALAGETFERDGQRVQVTPAAHSPRGPLIAWGGQSVAAARRAARFGLDFFAQTDTPELEAAYREECARQGRAPGNCTLANPDLPMTMFVADDVERAWDELGPYLLHDATTYAAWNQDSRTASISRGKTIAELRDEQGAHRVVTVPEAVGHVQKHGLLPLHPLCGGIPADLAWPYLERVVNDVLPQLA
jgi:alkanesulfonate monooxygenase SsuD/methylene tetrahydromethanopterin reductase-like flavin-dependent oxidoreductase (luciferase family)